MTVPRLPLRSAAAAPAGDRPQGWSVLAAVTALVPALLLVAAAASAQGEAAQRMLREAERQIASGNEAGALDEYRAVVSSFPGTSAAAQALVESGRLHLARGRTPEVIEVTDRLLSEYARLPEAAAGIVLQAEARRRQARSVTELDEIRNLLRRVANLFPRSSFPQLEARARARTILAEIDLLLGRYGAAAGELLEAVEREPGSSARTRARVDLALALLLDPDRDDTQVLGAIQSLQATVDEAAGESGAEDAEVGRARDLLALLHRTWLRPKGGQPIWIQGKMLPGVTVRKPRGVAGGPGGVVVATGTEAAVVVDGEGKAIATQVLRNGARPAVVDGTVLVATETQVHEHPSRRTESFAFLRDKLQELNKIVAVDRGAFGEWLLLDRGLGSVAVLSREEKSLRELPSARATVVDFAVGPLGRIYLLVEREPRVLVFGPDFVHVQTINGSWQRPQAIAVDAAGNVYVLDRATRTVEIRGPRGTLLAAVGPNLPGGLSLRSPEDVGVDGRGRLLLADGDAEGVMVLE